MHHYVKNGKPFESELPIYYFEWIYGNCGSAFGMFGTKEEYNARCVLDKDKDLKWEKKLIKKELVKETNKLL